MTKMLPETIHPIILCGGSGLRLWPLSRETYPKQFLDLIGTHSLLQATLRRAASLPAVVAPTLVSNENHRFLVAAQAQEIGMDLEDLILEPVARNTAPAICAAALRICEHSPNALMLVMPSDQAIDSDEVFRKAVAVAAHAAQGGKLVTFGIKPTFAATGYGYIKAKSKDGASDIDRFVEKPDAATAQTFLESGDYFWNSGMFLFAASVFIEEMGRHAPDVLAAVRSAVQNGREDSDFFRLDKASFEMSRSDSIDYAIMEHTSCAVVVPLDLKWSDVGSWDAVWDAAQHDGQGNHLHGDTMCLDTHNSLIHASHRMVATLGVRDVVVVETADAVLVATRSSSQDVKRLVEQIKSSGRNESMHHRMVFRPWGTYDSLENGARFQVKRITVNPGARLSQQMHHHRAEHWIVVSGTARITIGDTDHLLTENQSTYIPVGVVHCLENPGKIPLELIEVQSGAYLGEDDIVRFDDRYGRC